MTPADGFRFTCYCQDCRAFAHFLDRPDMLDAAGGTDIYQTAPARVVLTSGLDALRCIQRSPRVLRWYADCCRTAIANTATTPRFPIVALIRPFLAEHAALGPPQCRIFERSALAPLPPDAPPKPSVRMFARRSVKLLVWRARGLHRPNVFFDAHGAPRSPPTRVPR